MKNDPVINLGIDEDALAEEWMRQPGLYLKWALREASAKREAEHAKRLVEVSRAQMDHRCRKYPHKYGLDKVTDSSVNRAVELTQEVQEAERVYIDKKHTADVALAVVWAINQRKAALQNLVSLQLTNYYSTPQVDKGVRDMEKRAIRSQARTRHGEDSS